MAGMKQIQLKRKQELLNDKQAIEKIEIRLA